MTRQANTFKLGVFIIAAVTVFLAIVLALGAGNIFRTTATVETYFNETVQGLDIGSAVKYRGVQLGRVTRISFTWVKYQQDRPAKDRKAYVLVEAEFEPSLLIAKSAQDRLEEMILAGLRTRLAPLGITGAAYLEIDYVDPVANPPLEIAWQPDNLYIPSSPSAYNQIVSGTQKFLATLAAADLEGLVESIARVARTANDKLGELPIAALAQDASGTLKELRALVTRLDQTVASPEVSQAARDLSVATARLREVLANPAWSTAPTAAAEAFAKLKAIADDKHLQGALMRLDRILARLDTLTAGADTDVATALYNLRRVTENLRDITETTRRYPGSLFSEPPKPVNVR